MNFKFLVGQTVYHTLWKKNAIISRRLYIEDKVASYNAYDIAFICDDNSVFRIMDEALEKWLDEERAVID